ncbi:hypothetical protein AGABI1DRAFT_130168 [Agaricus bisporus var. burnettii JB137-S8]|uniref:Uncharacterized protein n=1 Tax=Agaricus bisporus var. burnettii (strain JB137-S8 / ATCC MYA-4627 / FGSC 10392) TaxID=597362 RepID=K5WQ32_AGABU|nr:uncharacterized protein AGABI1DRAFT_130168 [Agaricus bisporus var. burnettii JB137-S8]EKM77466.1 hypothetical protein AGABI1DRAFT_130168 [Agaricus bisporus var. burnettii JB137-S8]
MGCHWQEGSVILPINSPGVSAATTGATTTTAIATKGKMNAIVEAVASRMLFFFQPAYPHPVRYTCSYPGRGRTSTEAMKEKNAPRLPPELYSIIAYHLHRTTTLLNSCSLVSSAWLVASRKYTFRTVKLTWTNVFEFLKLVEDSRCSFKCWVRRLEMREGEYVVDRWINDVLPRLVQPGGGGGMQSVEVLEVYNLTWAELSPGAVAALTEGFVFPSERGNLTTTMKSLRVGTCYWECVHDFFGFVGSPLFAGLRTLVCDSVLLNCGMGSCRCFDVEEDLAGTAVSRNGNPNGSREFAGVKFPSALENLYLGSPEEKMVRWLIKEDAASRLEKLGLVVRERMLMNLIGQLLGSATEVKELALDFPDGALRFYSS